MKATGLLAAHWGSACRWDLEPVIKSYSFRYNLAVYLVIQHCFLLMQNPFMLFCRWWLRLAASCSIWRVGAFPAFRESWSNIMWSSGRLSRKQPTVVTPGRTEETAVSTITHAPSNRNPECYTAPAQLQAGAGVKDGRTGGLQCYKAARTQHRYTQFSWALFWWLTMWQKSVTISCPVQSMNNDCCHSWKTDNHHSPSGNMFQMIYIMKTCHTPCFILLKWTFSWKVHLAC